MAIILCSELYGNGSNYHYQLGLTDNNNRNEPEIIGELENVIDMLLLYIFYIYENDIF